jgi:hypothetical protein
LGFSNTNFGLFSVVLELDWPEVRLLLKASIIPAVVFAPLARKRVRYGVVEDTCHCLRDGYASGDLDALKMVECIAWSLVTTQFKFVGFRDTTLRVFS